ncbi:hypothetical protein [Tahibacter soli]|uniref:Uncharacterized protein n=1 Tax=Tahibacter soli TaxID=2983605 RepID=A0A9X3YR24_9GAMM|nr:hypothetical protein [Tahibacter soli]MDC8016144.1 hypothetical protein [Tahibacter soli]
MDESTHRTRRDGARAMPWIDVARGCAPNATAAVPPVGNFCVVVIAPFIANIVPQAQARNGGLRTSGTPPWRPFPYERRPLPNDPSRRSEQRREMRRPINCPILSRRPFD